MSRADQEFPHRENETHQNQQDPFEQRREAWASIASGLRQLFAATAVDLARLLPRLIPSGGTILFLIKAAAVGAFLTFMVAAATMLWTLQGARVEGLAAVSGPSLLVEAANGEPLGRVGPLGDALRRQDFPDILVSAVLSIEDRRFYRGVDMRGIARLRMRIGRPETRSKAAARLPSNSPTLRWRFAPALCGRRADGLGKPISTCANGHGFCIFSRDRDRGPPEETIRRARSPHRHNENAK